MITLYRADGDVDGPAMGRLGRWLLRGGCDSLLVFGTTGEGPSISVTEKIAVLRAMLDTGLPPHALIVGVGSPSLADAVRLTNAVGEMGAHALVLPPYFFRAAPREGIHVFYDELLRRTARIGTGVFLYHFTEMSTVAVDAEMMAALIGDHPGRMRGVKDSSGELASVTSWLQFPELAVFAGDDHLLRPLIAHGGAGVMTATAGLAPGLVKSVLASAKDDPATETAEDARLTTLWKEVLLAVPVTEAVKLIYATVTGDARWLRLRPPLRALDDDQTRETITRFKSVDEGGAISAALAELSGVFN
jgi:4-hydroxy-tetrahydrodipicolinate synthase